jgi:hypothetical protein
VTGRELIDAIGQAAGQLRRLRYQPVDAFADLTDGELEQASRGLDRLAVDCRAGADQLRRAAAARGATAGLGAGSASCESEGRSS